MEGLISSSCPMDALLRSPPLIPFRKKPPAAQRGGSDSTLSTYSVASMVMQISNVGGLDKTAGQTAGTGPTAFKRNIKGLTAQSYSRPN